MEWTFGDVLVCVDIDTASTVANHSSVRKKCVTFDGDYVDPSGLVSGGNFDYLLRFNFFIFYYGG